MWIKGTVVEVESDSFNGRPFYGAYIEEDTARARDAAQRVALTAVQYGGVAVGDVVEWPVQVKKGFEGRGFKVTLPEDFDLRAAASGIHAVG